VDKGRPSPADPPLDPLSDGLLLLRGDARYRSECGVSDDRDEVYLLCEVGNQDAGPRAHAVVRRTREDAVLLSLTGPADTLARLIRAISDTLRAEGMSMLFAGPELPDEVAACAGVAEPVSL
jgi:hypothetical protein